VVVLGLVVQAGMDLVLTAVVLALLIKVFQGEPALVLLVILDRLAVAVVLVERVEMQAGTAAMEGLE
jgi:predicted branched-subunit amino acid permease